MLLQLKPQQGAWSLLVLTQFGLAIGVTPTRRARTPRYLPGRYIVETASPQDNSEHTFSSILQKVISHVESHLDIEHIHHTYDHDLFSGFSVQLAGTTNHHHLRELEHVVKVHPVRLYDAINLPKVSGQQPFHPPHPSDQRHHGRGHPTPSSDAYGNDKFSSHKMTGVDKLHKKGILGAGVLVCVLDTGIDYKLPALGGCFGPNCHVKVGQDFVGDDGKHPDANPFAQCESHGTHVSGIIGALPNKDGFTGVAPEASIGMFRVFPCENFARDDVIIKALIAAAKSNCEVINLSIGSGGGFAEGSVTELLIDRLSANGVIVDISAGNAGGAGLFTTSSPALSSGATSVGSVNVESLPAFRFDLEGGGSLKTTAYLASARYKSTAYLPLVALSYKMEQDPVGAACVPIPASIDCEGSIVITQTGVCSLSTKLQNLVAAGAEVVALYSVDSTKELNVHNAKVFPIFPITFTAELVIPLLKALKANPNMKASLSGERFKDHDVVDTSGGGFVSDFSAMGPSGDMLHQGAFSAPGGNILSTLPSTDGGIGVMSGTSMAAPFVAGAAALLLSGRRSEKLTPKQIRSLFATTAKPLRAGPDSSELVSTLRQGAGLLQVDKAFEAKTLFSPIALSLNDTDHPQLEQEIKITNKNEFDVTYTFGSLAAQTLVAYNNSAIDDILPTEDPAQVHGSAEVMFHVPVLRVSAGKTGSIIVTFKPPTFSKPDRARIPFYSGFITIKGDECTQIEYSIPYFGSGARSIKIPILDTTSTFTGVALCDDGSTEHDYSSLPLPLLSTADTKLPIQVPQTDPEKLVMYHRATGVAAQIRLANPSRMVTFDVVHANTTFQANLPRRVRQTQHAGPVLENLNPTTMHFGEDPDDDENVPGSPSCPPLSNTQVIGRFATLVNLPRDLPNSGGGPATSTDAIFYGKLSKTLNPDDEKTKTPVPAHTPYRIIVRALKLTADPKYECSWESWLSPPFAFLD